MEDELLFEAEVSLFRATPIRIIFFSIITFGMALVILLGIHLLNKLTKSHMLPAVQIYPDKIKYIHRPNIIDKKEIELQIDDIKGIGDGSTIMQSLFGVGQVSFSTPATGQEEIYINGVPKKDIKKIRSLVEEQRKKLKSDQVTHITSNEKSDSKKIRELFELKEEGIITEEEFDKKKEKILA